MGHGPNDAGGSRYHIMAQVEGPALPAARDRPTLDLYQTALPRPDYARWRKPLRALDDLAAPGQSPLLRHLQLRGPGGSAKPCGPATGCTSRPSSRSSPSYSLFRPRARGGRYCPFLPGLWASRAPRLRGRWPADGSPAGTARDHPPPPDFPPWPSGARLVGAADEARAFDVLERLEARWQRNKGITLSQLALAWLLAQPGVTTALIGPRTVGQLARQPGSGWRCQSTPAGPGGR